MNKTTQKNFPFNIGADPEFNIIFQDQQINAETLCRSILGKDKKLKMDSSEMGYKIKEAGSIGWDGANATAEIRPAPAKNPNKIIENIQILFDAFTKNIQIYSLTTMSDKAPVGGHIHLEVNNENSKLDNPRKVNNIVKKISSFYTPIMLGEDIVNLQSRIHQGYGRMNDARKESKGENISTLELRSPTAEWLTTPKIAKSTLAYIAAVYHEILNHPRNFNKSKEILIQSDLQSKALQDLAITKYFPITQMLINKIKKHIKTFEYYKHYKEEIDFILSPKKVIHEKKKNNYDIMEGWNLTNNRQPTKRNLLSEKQIANAALKIDIDQMIKSVEIQHNADTNIPDFIRALKYRIITFNWKLKNNYFIFGLKPGIPEYIVTDDTLTKYYTGYKMIKTRLDHRTIIDTFHRMKDRFNPKSNKTSILIGVPYDKRIKLKIKEFIELIYNLEKGNLKLSKTYDIDKLIDDRDSRLENAGKIYQTYNSLSHDDLVVDRHNTMNQEQIASEIRNANIDEIDEIEESNDKYPI